MLVSTPAIVLYYTKYSDTSIILHLFSKSLGRQSVFVYGIKGKKTNKLSLFQPLYLIDSIIDFKPNRSVQVLKEQKLSPPLHNISSDVSKSTIALFIAEVLSKSIREESADENIFSFLNTSIKVLNEVEQGVGLFHIAFLVKLSRYLGFGIEEAPNSLLYYDLKKGKSVSEKPHHEFYISTAYFKMLHRILQSGYHELSEIDISVKDRNVLLQALVQLYEIHAINFNSFKSYNILKEVFY